MKLDMRDLAIGATVLIGLSCVGVLLLLFGEISTTRRPSYQLFLALDDAGGLTTTSRVTLNGVPVGSIRELSVSPDPRDGVTVALRIDESVRVPRDASVFISRGLVGDTSLALEARRSPAPAGQPTPPDPGFLDPGETLSATAQDVVDQIASMLDARLAGFEGAAASVQELAQRLSVLADSAQALLSPRTPADVDAGASPTLPSALARLDSALAGAQAWLGDASLREDAAHAVRTARETLDRAGAGLDAWTKAADTLTESARTLSADSSSAIRDFAQASRALGEVIADVQLITGQVVRAEGTLGQLVANPDLYRSLNDAAVRLEKALSEAQLLFETYRTEGLPIRF